MCDINEFFSNIVICDVIAYIVFIWYVTSLRTLYSFGLQLLYVQALRYTKNDDSKVMSTGILEQKKAYV